MEKPFGHDDLYYFVKLAEKYIKICETLNERLIFHPVNELRYALRDYLEAFGYSSETEQKKKIDESVRHAKRSAYDAIEMAILYYNNSINWFLDKYEPIPLSPTIPEISKIYADRNEIYEFVNRNHNNEKRVEQVAKMEEYFETLVRHNQTFIDSREELIKLLRKEKFSAFWRIIGLIIATIGSAAALAALFK